jgi:hypothetical protein
VLQRHDERVLVGLDRDRNRRRLVGVLGQQLQQLAVTARSSVDPLTGHDLTLLVGQGDVVMGLSLVDPAGDAHSPPLHDDLGQALRGGAAT